MSRSEASRPLKQALEDQIITSGTTVFDYGCGRGDDIRHMRLLGIDVTGWDPAHEPDSPKKPADVVNLGYVVNVIEDPEERAKTLVDAWSLARRVFVVSARLDWELATFHGRPFGDGFLTTDQTFQKFYGQDELRAWLEQVLGEKVVAAAPGIFYIFRDSSLRQALLSRKTRRKASSRGVSDLIYAEHHSLLKELEDFVIERKKLPTSAEIPNGSQIVELFGSLGSAYHVVRRASTRFDWTTLAIGKQTKTERIFDESLEVLQPLMDFVDERGRLPRPGELPDEDLISDEFGSIGRAFNVIRRVTGFARWDRAAESARENLLVYVALSNFGGRPRFGQLPEELRADVKDLVGSYREACTQADAMLFALGEQETLSEVCATSAIGKLTPEALYVHTSALHSLHPLLRLYEGCARALVGDIDGHVVLKMNRLKPQVSYLLYPAFDKEAHPPVEGSVVCRIGKLEVDYRNYRDSRNPHILHRKELLVDTDYPLRERFARLTEREEAAGLLGQPGIGTKNGWEDLLRLTAVEIRGHRLTKS